METFTITERGIEESADAIKAVVLTSLVKDGLLSFDDAEEYAKTHTVLYRKKSFFRTITNLWNKQEYDDDKFYFLVVSIPEEPEYEDDTPEKDELPKENGKVITLR